MIATIALAIYVVGAVFISGYILPEEASSSNPEWRLALLVILAWPFFVAIAVMNGNLP